MFIVLGAYFAEFRRGLEMIMFFFLKVSVI